MIDTNTLSLSEFTFALETKGLSRRHPVDAMATVCWFHELSRHADADSVADVVRYYAPVAESTIEQTKRLHRQWSERSKGRRSPGGETITLANQRCPGSAAILFHAIWLALRIDWPAKRQLAAVQGKLSGDKLCSLVDVTSDRQAERLARAMKRRGTLDDLACLLMFLRIATDAGSSTACKVRVDPYRALVVTRNSD